MNAKERFIEYLKMKGIGQTSFEQSSGLSRGSISQKSGFSANSIEKIAIACPDLNLEWLILGNEPMLKSEVSTLPKQSVSQVDSSVIMIPFEEYKKSIAEKDEIIKDQAHKIGMLEHELQLFTSKKQTALGTENVFTAADQQRNIPEAE
jgi:putative phage repressor